MALALTAALGGLAGCSGGDDDLPPAPDSTSPANTRTPPGRETTSLPPGTTVPAPVPQPAPGTGIPIPSLPQD